MTEINLWLDSYDDIYSDFDSRHFVKRKISEDFLYELHREIKSGEQHADGIGLLLPQDRRNESEEKIIADSLKNFFDIQYRFNQDKCRKKLKNGIYLLVTGVLVMLINSFITYNYRPSFYIISLKILLEPAGWFLFWTALDSMFYDFRSLKKERNFYRALSKIACALQVFLNRIGQVQSILRTS